MDDKPVSAKNAPSAEGEPQKFVENYQRGNAEGNLTVNSLVLVDSPEAEARESHVTPGCSALGTWLTLIENSGSAQLRFRSCRFPYIKLSFIQLDLPPLEGFGLL